MAGHPCFDGGFSLENQRGLKQFGKLSEGSGGDAEAFPEGFLLPFKAFEVSLCKNLTAFPTAHKLFELEWP